MYSNLANVMHYLVRLEPFTTLHIQLQSDRFDLADRQFYSIGSTWRILLESPNDVKELIPEFFYLAEFLENMNNFDFGELQISKNKVNNVALPPWAKSPEHFIYLHRKALESDYVSEHLNEWIDLIFGFKQQGAEAVKALNVFMYCSYEGAIDLDAITDSVARHATEAMISNFGQTPTQLFKEPHLKRKTKEQAIRDKIVQGLPIILWKQINNLKAYYVELLDPKNEAFDPIVFISIPRNHTKSFMQQGLSDPLISISKSGVLGVNGWQAYERSMTNLFSFEKDPSLLNPKTKKSIAGPWFDPNHDVDNKLFILTHDSKLIISGGHWDNSLRVFSLSKYRNIAQIYQHSNIVTCLAIDYTGTIVVSGSMDCTCMVWQVIQEYGQSTNLDPVPMHILYGHSDTITSVDISNELDIIVSASIDGTVNMYTILKGHYVRSLYFGIDRHIRFTNLLVKLNTQRHLVVYVSGSMYGGTGYNDLFETKEVNELYLYSINGKFICKESLGYTVQDMIVRGDHCILGVQGLTRSLTPDSSFNSSSGSADRFAERSPSIDLTNSPQQPSQKKPTSKIVFKENYDLRTIQTMRLKAPITCMFLTREDSHLLVALKDGKLIVITGERQLK